MTPMSPDVVRATTRVASPDQTLRSAATSSTCSSAAKVGSSGHHPALLPGVGSKSSRRTEGEGPHPARCGPAPSLQNRGSGDAELLGVGLQVLDATAEEERLLREVVVLAVDDRVERGDRLVQRDVRPVDAGELLGDVGVLGQEALHATGTVDDELVLLAELVDTEDRDDVLKVLVLLKNRLDAHRGRVVVRRDVAGV